MMVLTTLLTMAMQGAVPAPAFPAPLDVVDQMRAAPRVDAKAMHGPRLVNLAEVFSNDNYPYWALKNWDEGRVRFRVEVDAIGRPAACAIVEPSRVATLDQPTCDLIMAQARFEPATDQRGRPIAGTYSRVVQWVTAQIEPWPVADRSERAILWVDAAGKRQCRIEEMPGELTDSRSCATYVETPGIVVALARLLVARREGREHWELVWHQGSLIPGGPAGDGSTIGSHVGEDLLERTRVRVTIDAAGRVTDCTPIELGSASAAEWVAACKTIRQERYEPAAGAGERVVMEVSATYVRRR